MPLYETVLIARNELTQQQVEAVADQVTAILTEAGGEVKKNRKGHYMLLGLDCAPAVEQEVARQLGLNEDVLRHMTLRVEEITDEPSAILARRGEDRERDRGFRGPRPAGRFSSGRRDRDDREEFRARPRDEIEQPQGEE